MGSGNHLPMSRKEIENFFFYSQLRRELVLPRAKLISIRDDEVHDSSLDFTSKTSASGISWRAIIDLFDRVVQKGSCCLGGEQRAKIRGKLQFKRHLLKWILSKKKVFFKKNGSPYHLNQSKNIIVLFFYHTLYLSKFSPNPS